MPRRIPYPGERYPDAWVSVPDEWLGEHLLKRNRAAEIANAYGVQSITRAAIALAIADDWGGIPGIEGKDPDKWDFKVTPIPILQWLVDAVFEDFSKAFVVPKNLSAPSANGSTAKLATESTAGTSATPN